LAGRIGDLARVYSVEVETMRVVVSAYNLWYLQFMTRVPILNATAQLGPWLPLSYQQAAWALFSICTILVLALTLRRRRRAAVAAAALSLGMFMLLTHVAERYMFPALAFLLLAAAERTAQPGAASEEDRSRLWWAFAILSLTFLFNVVTVAPFTPALGINLIAAPLDMAHLTLKRLSFISAGVNLVVLAWLLVDLLVLRDTDQS
jgi:hypothetical protein